MEDIAPRFSQKLGLVARHRGSATPALQTNPASSGSSGVDSGVVLGFILASVSLAAFWFVSSASPWPLRLGVVFMAAALSPAAYFGAQLVAGARGGDFARRQMLSWSALYTALMLMMTTLLLMFGLTEPMALAPGVALLVVFGVFAASARLWLTPLRPIYALRQALDQGGNREALSAVVDDIVRGAPSSSGLAQRRHAQRVLAATTVLAEARAFEEAARVLDSVEVRRLRGQRRALLSGSRASVYLYVDRRNDAWASLKDAMTHAQSPILVTALRLTDALLSALDDRAEQALKILDEVGRPTEPRLLRAYLLASGFAHARRTPARARESFEQLDVPGLKRACTLEGAGAALAAEVLATRE
ncbi:MAG: hypothetical protein R3B13_10175 [Polyangiaceae bacterium]